MLEAEHEDGLHSPTLLGETIDICSGQSVSALVTIVPMQFVNLVCKTKKRKRQQAWTYIKLAQLLQEIALP